MEDDIGVLTVIFNVFAIGKIGASFNDSTRIIRTNDDIFVVRK